ncbi:MAG: ornithine carbamoyltransferase [Planctomycetaceae bacterium]|nr:ornithine carbamoyltransferase [Planctomycetaceae bacterium]
MKHILSIIDLAPADLEAILNESALMKDRYRQGIFDPLYQGKTLGMYFEKPSLRTRVSLESAMNSFGGGSVCLESSGPNQMWRRESVKDQARVMSRFVSMVSMRTFSQDVIEEFAREATVPVVNVLSDFGHPTQAMADFLTMKERFGDLKGKTLVYLGDGNNVARSLLAASAYLGVRFIWSGPEDYRLDQDYVERVMAKAVDAEFIEELDPAKAVKHANVVYTDVWASMGQEEEAARREMEFSAYQVNEKLMSHAPAKAIVLHCLPAHRGSEITDGIMDGHQAAVYDQAENRMHIYRGIFSMWAGNWRI